MEVFFKQGPITKRIFPLSEIIEDREINKEQQRRRKSMQTTDKNIIHFVLGFVHSKWCEEQKKK